MLVLFRQAEVASDNVSVQQIGGGAFEFLSPYDVLNRINDCKKLYALVFLVFSPSLASDIKKNMKTAERHRPHFRDFGLIGRALELHQLNRHKRISIDPIEILDACAPHLFRVVKDRTPTKA